MSKRANMLKRLRTKSVEKEKELGDTKSGVEKGRNASQDPNSVAKMMFQKKYTLQVRREDDIDPLTFAETHKVKVDTTFYDSIIETIRSEKNDEEEEKKKAKGIGQGMMGMMGMLAGPNGRINFKEVLNAKKKLGKTEEEKKQIDKKIEEEKKEKEKLKEQGILSSSDEEEPGETIEQRKKRMEEHKKKKEKLYAEKTFLPEMTNEQRIRLINRIRAGRKNFKFYYETLIKIQHKSMILQKADWAKKEWELPEEFCKKVDEIVAQTLPFPCIFDKCNQIIKDDDYDKLEVPVKKLSDEEIMKLFS